MPKKIIYVEFLTVSHLIQDILPALRKLSTPGCLCVFDATKSAFFLSQFFGRIFHFEVEKISFEMADARDEKGTCVYLQVRFQALLRFQELIPKESPMEGRLEAYLAKAPVCVYDLYGEAKYSEIWHALVLIGLVQWHSRKLIKEAGLIDLYIYDRPLGNTLDSYAQENHVKLHFFGPFQSRELPFNKIWTLCKKIKPSLLFNLIKARLFSKKDPPVPAPQSASIPARMMVEYWGQFNLDRPGCISDLFFVDSQGIQGNDICLVFNNRRDPVDREKYSQMVKHGITAVSRTIQSSLVDENKVPVFNYQPQASSMENYPQIWRAHTQAYLKTRDYWKKFFQTYNIKLYTSWFKYDPSHIAMADAINDIGGISSIYQRSYESNPSPFFSVGSDLIFGFSPQGYELHRKSHSNFKYHITVGYIGDSRFKYLQSQAKEIRSQLSQKGAEHIIAYFDENSVDDGRWFMGHKLLRENYGFWLNKILEDKKLGIIFKPKVPGTLQKRLGPVADLLIKAQETGRCYIFNEGITQGSFPPAAAALAADFSIQECLWAGTAGVEAALSGCKTLLLDLEGIPSSPLYKLGPKVVFKNQLDLWNACQEHWKSPGGNPALGNWSSMIDEIDPFHDGCAAQRMSGYLKELLEGLRRGDKPKDVMEKTAENYAKLWGKDKVQRA